MLIGPNESCSFPSITSWLKCSSFSVTLEIRFVEMISNQKDACDRLTTLCGIATIN